MNVGRKRNFACGGIVKNFKCDYFVNGDHEDYFYPTVKNKSIFKHIDDNVDKNINIVINMKSTFGGFNP